MTGLDALRIASIALGVVALILWLIWAWRSPSWLYAVPVILWLANGLAFLIVRQTGYRDVVILNAWSLAVYLQAAITLAGAGAYFLRHRFLEPRADC
jgi:hypothetical protein